MGMPAENWASPHWAPALGLRAPDTPSGHRACRYWTPTPSTRQPGTKYPQEVPGILILGTGQTGHQAPTPASPGRELGHCGTGQQHGTALRPAWVLAPGPLAPAQRGQAAGTSCGTGTTRQPLLCWAPVPPPAQCLTLMPTTVVVTLVLSPSPDCSFTCHYRCRALVRLDCSGPLGAGDEDDGTEQALEKDTNVVGPSPCL